MSGQIGQVNVGRRPQGMVGKRLFTDPNDTIRYLVNKSPQAKQVDTITVTGATNSTAYTAVIDGVTCTYTSDATATIAEIADGLAAAIAAEPLANSVVSVSSDGVSVVTLTARIPGLAFVMTAPHAQTTAATTTAAASAAAIPIGRGVITQGYSSESYGEANELCALAASSLMTAQVATVTPVYLANSTTTVRVRDMHSGRVIAETTQTHDTNIADLCTEIATDLNTTLPANSVIADGSSGTTVTLTAEVAGLEFDVEVGVGEGTAATPSTCALAYTTGPNESTSILRALRGISLWSAAIEDSALAAADLQHAANAGLPAIAKGSVWVESSQTIGNDDDVYIELGVAADNGQFFNTNSATRLLVPFARWRRDSADGNLAAIAGLEINLDQLKY